MTEYYSFGYSLKDVSPCTGYKVSILSVTLKTVELGSTSMVRG